jgi:hypothetical protein
MQAATAPASIRAQALGLIAAHLTGPVSLDRRLAEVGTEALCDLLITLEEAFEINLDADELWPAATVHDLAELVEIKLHDKARLALTAVFNLAAERSRRAAHVISAEPEAWTPREPMFPAPPDANAVRAGRAFDRERQARALILRGLRLCALAGWAAAVAFFVLEPR